MKTKSIVFIFILLCASVLTVTSQEPEKIPKVEVFGGYSLLRSEGSNFNGWKTSVDFTVNKWLAIAVDADGYYHSNSTSSGTENNSEYSLTAGPHISFRNKSKFVPFTYAMAGAGWENNTDHGIRESSSGFAFETGGGVDFEASEKISIRIIDISASITRIDGETAIKPKFTTGIIFKFGRK